MGPTKVGRAIRISKQPYDSKKSRFHARASGERGEIRGQNTRTAGLKGYKWQANARSW